MTGDDFNGRKREAGKSSWRPSSWGRRATKCADWSLTLDGDHLALEGDVDPFTTTVSEIGDVTVDAGFVWATIDIGHPSRRLRLRGIPNRKARHIAKVLGAAKADLAQRIEVQSLIAGYEAAAARVLNWVDELSRAAAQ